jgi:hypothetical protein
MTRAYARLMASHVSALVVASVTATSPELIGALKERAARGSLHATLVMPCSGPGFAARDQAQPQLDEALASWREAGLQDIDGVVGDQDPIVAAREAWDPKRYDEIIVSTLPGHASNWLRFDVPHRLAQATDAQVTHVVASRHIEAPPAEPVARKEPSPLGPLSVLSWGHPQEETTQERRRRLHG